MKNAKERYVTNALLACRDREKSLIPHSGICIRVGLCGIKRRSLRQNANMAFIDYRLNPQIFRFTSKNNSVIENNLKKHKFELCYAISTQSTICLILFIFRLGSPGADLDVKYIQTTNNPMLQKLRIIF